MIRFLQVFIGITTFLTALTLALLPLLLGATMFFNFIGPVWTGIIVFYLLIYSLIKS